MNYGLGGMGGMGYGMGMGCGGYGHPGAMLTQDALLSARGIEGTALEARFNEYRMDTKVATSCGLPSPRRLPQPRPATGSVTPRQPQLDEPDSSDESDDEEDDENDGVGQIAPSEAVPLKEEPPAVSRPSNVPQLSVPETLAGPGVETGAAKEGEAVLSDDDDDVGEPEPPDFGELLARAMLGFGSFGVLKLVEDIDTGAMYTLKGVNKERMLDEPQVVKSVMHEIHMAGLLVRVPRGPTWEQRTSLGSLTASPSPPSLPPGSPASVEPRLKSALTARERRLRAGPRPARAAPHRALPRRRRALPAARGGAGRHAH